MDEVESCFVDGWRRNFDSKEFISYRIVINFKDSEKTQTIERRYSEFLTFHTEVNKTSFNEVVQNNLDEECV